MFGFTKAKKIGVYIDYSNMYHAKYTLGWEYDIDQFLEAMKEDQRIEKVCFYGAYDKLNIKQYNRTKKLKKKFSQDKYRFYFKELELKGGNHKGNVDTEMGFEIAEDKNHRDCLVLFSGDGDFLFIIDTLIKKYNKKIVIVSTKGHIAKELVNYTQTYPKDICRFVDIHQTNKIALSIQQNLKNEERGLCIPPEVLDVVKNATKKQLQEIADWLTLIINNQWKPKKGLPKLFQGLQNKNHYPSYKTILHWKIQEKQLFKDYIESLLT